MYTNQNSGLIRNKALVNVNSSRSKAMLYYNNQIQMQFLFIVKV